MGGGDRRTLRNLGVPRGKSSGTKAAGVPEVLGTW